jgi:colanic acid biosynthesis glycosyl transferase WcaI
MVGIIHPCKIYGAMAVARPILYFGPSPSHISDLLEKHRFGLHVSHGDVAGAIDAIASLRDAGEPARFAMGKTAQDVLRGSLSQQILCERFCDSLERVLQKENRYEAADTAGLAGTGPGADAGRV